MPADDLQELICSVIGDGEILLIVPPFGSVCNISLGLHTLWVLAKEQGFSCDILYLNMLLATVIGVEEYEEIRAAPMFRMLSERLFARSAYGLPSLGRHPEWCADEAVAVRGGLPHAQLYYEASTPVDMDRYLQLEERCHAFLEEAVPVIASLDYGMIGCTAMTGQINCSVAILTRLKQRCPATVTLMGGSNCVAEMAEGIALLSESIDYVFSGESETSFLKFLHEYPRQQLPAQRVIQGEPLSDLDLLPLPDYEICLRQYARFLGEYDPSPPRIWYETSRGCWWAEKSRCTFCGIPHGAFRHKSVKKVIHDMTCIRRLSSHNMLFIADNVMPSSYHSELLPALSVQEDLPRLGYQLRATLDVQELLALKQANIRLILPGIESLSTHVLNLIHKGTTSGQNLMFLRNALSVGIYCDWLMLWGFPGDRIADYEEILQVLPLIRHLQPPRRFGPMELMRFSPYFENPREYGITNLRPWAVYEAIYPDWADLEKLAYYYIGDYPCEAYEYPEIIRKLADEVVLWRNSWKRSMLRMQDLMGIYIVYDNRDTYGKARTHVVDDQQAQEIMRYAVYTATAAQQWAVENKLGVVLDGWYVPLVTASAELLVEFEKKRN